MKKISFPTSILNGMFKRNRNSILRAIKAFEGKDIIITLERDSTKRSNRQNNYYWGVVIPIVREGIYEATGEVYLGEKLHYEVLLPKFGPARNLINTITGEAIDVKIGSAEMSKTEFSDYIEAIQKFGAEYLGVDIPSPEEKLELFNN